MIITINIVWFKRDLRVNDNQVLSDASKIGHVIPLYIIEPDLWKQPDLSYRQYCFLQESLKDLQKSLSLLGQPLIIKVGNVLDVFSEILNTHNVTKVWSHEETWNGWTYERDKGVAKYLKEKGIPWRQIPQNGVIRNIDCRDG
jgi:deoxyribodipyrimidine photo-lyase